jgi:putative ABC transport system ATP-binding protein
MARLEANDLYRFYHAGEDETLALRGVSLSVASGESVAVVGPSGSGKSTLLACLAGLDEPDGGFVTIDGERITRRPEFVRAAIRATKVGIVLQMSNLFDHLTVEQNVRLQMRLARKSDSRRVHEVIDLVGLTDRRNARLGQLSGGEAARAGLAVALAPSPPVLLADEPTGEVDAGTEERILQLFDDHKRDGGVSLIVTHSDVVAGRADRIIHLFDGRIADA